MGRAYEVRKASIQKTGAVKAKLYSMYAKEIYLAAKAGGIDPASNINLKRLMEKAKKEQVPGDIIKRAIDKVTSGIGEDYVAVKYEIIGPGGSSLIVEGLTDNGNRTLSDLRPALNKNNGKLGVANSVSYNYDHLSVIAFKYNDEEKVLEMLLEAGIEIDDLEKEDDIITVYGLPQDLYNIKETISDNLSNIEFIVDEITMLPKDKITLTGDDLSQFQRMLEMIDEVNDVTKVYHNVEL